MTKGNYGDKIKENKVWWCDMARKVLAIVLIVLIVAISTGFDSMPSRNELMGILRQNSDGKWEILSDQNHSPLNIESVSQDNSQIRVNYKFTTKKIKTFIVTGDDVLNKTGYVFGGDVGTSYANITIRKNAPISGFISSDKNGNLVVLDNIGLKDVSYANGIITFKHEPSLNHLTPPILTMFAGRKYNLEAYNFSNVLSEFKLVNMDGSKPDEYPEKLELNDVRFFFSRESQDSGVTINPSTRMPSGNNIWIYAVFE